MLSGGQDPRALLARTIEREFNRPFEPAAHEQPFRFIAIDEGAAFLLVLVYDHYVASGDSIARLLTEPGLCAGQAGHGARATAAAPAARPVTAARWCATLAGRCARCSACPA